MLELCDILRPIFKPTYLCLFRLKKTLYTLISELYGDPIGIRTREPAVRGRCLNRLTMGPKINKDHSVDNLNEAKDIKKW